ncbi:MAG: hypothetical protein U0105_20155 [Candidatus Obscuribacterales bacterium]
MPFATASRHSESAAPKAAASSVAAPAPASLPLPVVALAGLALFAFNLIAYQGALGIGFFCDDFVHLAFFKQVSDQKHWMALLECFWQPYLNAARELYYRPLVETSIAFDSLAWHGQPFGFHLTNILIHSGVASLLAWNIAQLLAVDEPETSGRRRFAIAFACACLFSVYPLASESVIWMIGRVDSLCSLFYLAALGCFQRHCSRDEADSLHRGWRSPWLMSTLICFAAALCCKEMAVTLPVVMTLYCWFFARRYLRQSLLSWAVVAAYLLVRTAVLGTVLGGPVAVRSLHAPFLSRILEPSCYFRLFFPVKASLDYATLFMRLLTVLWIGLAALLPWRKPSRAIVFCLLWAAIVLAPAFPVFYIGEQMENGRLVYMMAGPLLSALVIACFRLRSKAALVLLTALGCAFFAITACTVAVWKAADVESNCFINEVRHLQRPGCIINPPLIHKGAFQFFTAASVHLAFQLLPEKESRRAIANTAFLEPLFRPNDCGMLNITELRNRLRQGKDVFTWDGERLARVDDVPELRPTRQSAEIIAPTPMRPPYCLPDARIVNFRKPFTTLNMDLLDVDVQAQKVQQSGYDCWLTVTPRDKENAIPEIHVPFTGPGRYRICISDRLNWFEHGKIKSLEVRLSDCAWRFKSLQVTARPKAEDSPLLTRPQPDSEGVVRTTATTLFQADASMMPKAQRILVHVSNAHYRLMESRWSIFQAPVTVKLPGEGFQLPGKVVSFSIPDFAVPDKNATYEVRVGALDASGKPTGYWSDPVSISFAAAGGQK